MSGPLFILIFLVSCLLLAKSGSWAVHALIRIADFLRWKRFIVASLIMGFVTSLPEFFVGITASFAKKPQLSFGNIIGSNIILLTLVIGVAVLLGGTIKLKGKTIQRSLLFAVFYALLPLLLILDGYASRGDGAILVVAFMFYLRELISAQRQFSKEFAEKRNMIVKRFKSFLKEIGMFLFSFGLLILAAEAIVFSAGRLALQFNLPLIFIGVLGVALGTTLPELTVGIRSVMLKQKEMVLGNIFGAIAIHSALILGIVCLISPFRIYDISLYLSTFIFTGVIILAFFVFSKTGDEVTRKESYILISLYVLFFIVQLLLK